MKVIVKGVPPSMNRFAGRGNTWEYRNEKKKWTLAVWASCKACKERPAKPFQKAVVEITYFFPTRIRRDADNYSGKFILDGLTKAGIIVDDNMTRITTTVRGDYDKKNPRTEITITEITANE